MTRIAAREKLTAIVKMKTGKCPPQEYVRMHIGGDIYTIEAYEDDLRELGRDETIVSLEYARPTHQLTTLRPESQTSTTCQKCGSALGGEAAQVGNAVWCHPCADDAPESLQDRVSK